MADELPEGTLATQAVGSAAARPPSGLRAMVVEDELQLATLLASYLERDGFDVTIAHDGQQAVATAREVDPDVIVLDLGLPTLDGIEVCRQVRTFSDAYVVMLTARSDEVDTLIGLSVGADDYMTKPFSPRVLMARIQGMLRRPRVTGGAAGQPNDVRTFGALSVDPVARDVWLDGRAGGPDAHRVRPAGRALGAPADGIQPPPAHRHRLGSHLGR